MLVLLLKKKVICIFPQNRYKEFHEKIIKSYFNIWYIKFFYLLQKNIKLHKNSYNINVLMNIFMNLYDNSDIKCNLISNLIINSHDLLYIYFENLFQKIFSKS